MFTFSHRRRGTTSVVDEANKVCTPYIRYGTAPGFPAANCVSGGGSRAGVPRKRACRVFGGSRVAVDEANEIIANKRFFRFSLQGERLLKPKAPKGKIMDSDITVRVGDEFLTFPCWGRGTACGG